MNIVRPSSIFLPLVLCVCVSQSAATSNCSISQIFFVVFWMLNHGPSFQCLNALFLSSSFDWQTVLNLKCGNGKCSKWKTFQPNISLHQANRMRIIWPIAVNSSSRHTPYVYTQVNKYIRRCTTLYAIRFYSLCKQYVSSNNCIGIVCRRFTESDSVSLDSVQPNGK